MASIDAAAIEAAINDLKASIEKNDLAAMKTRMEALAERQLVSKAFRHLVTTEGTRAVLERLDEAAELAKLEHAFATDLANAVARVVEKYHDDRAATGRTFACAVSLHPHVVHAEQGASE